MNPFRKGITSFLPGDRDAILSVSSRGWGLTPDGPAAGLTPAGVGVKKNCRGKTSTGTGVKNICRGYAQDGVGV